MEKQPKDVLVRNRHGREVHVPYTFYVDHGAQTGLTLVEKASELKSDDKPEIAEVSRPKSKDVADVVKPEAEAIFICDVCGKVCKTKGGLTTHMKKHETKSKKKSTAKKKKKMSK